MNYTVIASRIHDSKSYEHICHIGKVSTVAMEMVRLLYANFRLLIGFLSFYLTLEQKLNKKSEKKQKARSEAIKIWMFWCEASLHAFLFVTRPV